MIPYPLFTSRLIQESIFRTGRKWMIRNEEDEEVIKKVEEELKNNPKL